MFNYTKKYFELLMKYGIVNSATTKRIS